jgi:C-terminal processing protease CtpA/Prc
VWDDFTTAVSELMDTDGLIIDERFNIGGSPDQWNGGFALLFNEAVEQVMSFAVRKNGDDYLELNLDTLIWYSIPADENSFYDKPLAILQGPKSVSGGDIFSYFVKYHPHARRFGRATNGSFGSPKDLFDRDPVLHDFSFRYTNYISLDSEMKHIQGLEQTPEELVWLKKTDIDNGVDTVVNRAIEWIGER